MNVEERAHKVVDDWATASCNAPPMVSVYALIAQALRDERNEALEEAAIHLDGFADNLEKSEDAPPIDNLTAGFIASGTAKVAAEGIRSLKDTPEKAK